MTSHFSLLNISPTFDIDISNLESEYFKAQRQFHPDRFVGKPQAEKMAALQKSMDINEAYENLKNPLKRAQYLLKSQGIIVGTEADNIKPSKELLMEIMELSEQLEEEENKDSRTKLVNQLKISYQNSLLDISKYYANKEWQKMAQETLRLGYLVKILDEKARKGK